MGPFAKWAKIEITLVGPDERSSGEPNPFAISLDATFTAPSGKQHKVPGFYDGDGRGGSDGNVWKVRFAGDEVGVWSYKTESPHTLLSAQTGRFTVTATPADADGFWRCGRLESVGTVENQIRYLKFRDGPYWLKEGCDDPENFLGNYRHFDTLAEWRELFEHMQTRGVVPYLVLEDDSAWTGYDHDRYYREIVARFGDVPAVLFNIGEEHNENYSLAQALALAKQFKQLDPYGHPLGIHNVNQPADAYIDSLHVDFTSIQTGSPGSRRGLEPALEHNRMALDWLRRCRERGRRALVVNFDEARPELDRRAWWSVYLGGGVWESHVPGPYDQPLSVWEPAWSELGGARAFLKSLPFWEMHPHNDLVEEGRAFCLAAPGTHYAVYLPQGGTIRLRLADSGPYEAQWWNPANDRRGRFQNSIRVPGGVQPFTAPGSGDWALRVKRQR